MKPLFEAGLFFLFFINRAVAQQPLFCTYVAAILRRRLSVRSQHKNQRKQENRRRAP
jgi:hypothetical protein